MKVVDVTVVESIVWLKMTTTCEPTATFIAPLAGTVESTRGDCVINVNNDELELLLLPLQEIKMIEAIIIADVDRIDNFFILDTFN